jgi:hypothetical protein
VTREPEKRADKRKRSASDRRRAATYLQQLAWLDGFPDGEGWRRLDGELHALDGAIVARSRRAARSAIREHRDGLRALVGDVERWWAIVDAKLAWCSTRRGTLDLIDRAPPRIARAARQLAATSHLREAVVAAGVAWALRPDVLQRVLAWLSAHAGALAGFDVAVMLQLAALAETHAAGADALIALLHLDAPDPQASLEVLANLGNRLRGGRVAPAPAPGRTTPHVQAWLTRLVEREPLARERALALLAAANLTGALEPWSTWERANAGRIERARAFADRDFDRVTEELHLERIQHALELARKAAPPLLRLDDALLEIDLLASTTMLRFHAPAISLLEALPASRGPAAGMRMLLHVARAAATSDDARPAWLWEATAKVLAGGADARLLGPWRDVFVDGGRAYLDADLVDPLKRRGEIVRLVEVLARLAARGEVSHQDGERAAVWIAAGLANEAVVPAVERLRGFGGVHEVDLARAAIAISDGTSADLATQASALLAQGDELSHRASREFAALVSHGARTDAAWLVRGVLAAGQGAALAHLAGIIALLPGTRWPAMVIDAPDTRWIARYPAALGPALERLATVDPEAAATARRRLASDLPDPDELRRELLVLRARAPLAPSVAKRAANLEDRLASPRPLSSQRLARLAAKLDQAATTIGLARFTDAVTARATARLVKTFGLDAWPDWQLDRRTQEILFGLLRLEEPDRVLAGRLLRARVGLRPWDLRDEPANRTFLDRMRARGLDPAPWLDDSPSIVTASDGKPLELALCSDPLEVFAMGAHFDTCLSPDGSNFFSVVANAADINKRVLYARRGSRVVGRCLLALTETFAVLTFHAYCHDAIELPKLVGAFANQLAERVGTTVATQGSVATLLARDWYDDGARDLVGRFAALHDTSRLDLATIDPAVLPEVLRDVLGRPLDDMTLPIVLGLPGLHERPALIHALAPSLLAAGATMPTAMIRAARLAMRVGDPALADRLLGDHENAVDLRDAAWTDGELLAQLRPSVALARLRATRPRGVRRLGDETGERLAVAAVALETLRRPHQAAALYRRVTGTEWLHNEIRGRLRALET